MKMLPSPVQLKAIQSLTSPGQDLINDGHVITFPLTITGKENAGGYRCTAGNGVSDPAVADVFIAVLSESNVIL